MKLQEFYNRDLEFGPDIIANDRELAQSIQQQLTRLGFLDPPADGKFGPISLAALKKFQEAANLKEDSGFLSRQTAKKLIETKPEDFPAPEIALGNDMASRIVRYMKAKNFVISTRPNEVNIIYLEGVDPGTFKVNNDAPNYFNDTRCLLRIIDKKPVITDSWEATTEPGFRYTYKPMNQSGAARIAFGQYKAWKVGTHYGGGSEPHEALIQVSPKLLVHRDFNKDMKRTGDKIEEGLFGINQHHGFDLPRNNILYASAGCLVGRLRKGHRDFMGKIKEDWRYVVNNEFLFYTTILNGEELMELDFVKKE
jgi:hypothetical protein